ncbi:hypothetical protein [Edaphobacter modestus]|uniref:TonB-dependent transporter Oar-like beta-barrel domain-containing protein n=1 Tax=Edaphobacter modestus TaxID=388466 RepID=A0A4Q7YNP6_9BACT|nr:hypothetical protein [Edaphobacter modestus]RZU39267.1 hypothetical protein BDD14_0627 [Edaphobacter modestus]
MSSFNSLVAGVNRRFHNGLFLGGNYMYSHALNDGSVGAGDGDAAQNLACFRCDYASSDFDSRHSGTFSVVYELPFGRGRRYLNRSIGVDLLTGGWSVNTLLSARAGLPVNVTLSRSSNELPDGNNSGQRPDRVSGVPLYLGSRSISHWINPAAFSLPVVGTWGNAGRNLLTGPPLWQNDSAIEKNFRITDRDNVIFRAEAFNIFNRAQYGQPSSSLSVTTTPCTNKTQNCVIRTLTVPSSFGKITSTVNNAGLVGTGTPRVLEFSLRITY